VDREPKDTGKAERDEPVTLAPLEPEDALRALLQVKPEEDEEDSSD
jgi:hypothetical protein